MSESLTENDIKAAKAELCGACRCKKKKKADKYLIVIIIIIIIIIIK